MILLPLYHKNLLVNFYIDVYEKRQVFKGIVIEYYMCNSALLYRQNHENKKKYEMLIKLLKFILK